MILDKLENSSLYAAISPRISKAFRYLEQTDFSKIEPCILEIQGKDLFAIISEYETKETVGLFPEAHRKYIDVQFMVSGEEQIGYAYIENQSLQKAYSEIEDYALYQAELDYFCLKSGMFAIFFPHDLHLPCIAKNEKMTVKKVVVKVKLDDV